MTTNPRSLALGFAFGAATLLMLGQSDPYAAARAAGAAQARRDLGYDKSGTPGRYAMINTSAGICVLDTALGVVKVLPPEMMRPDNTSTGLVLGVPFESR